MHGPFLTPQKLEDEKVLKNVGMQRGEKAKNVKRVFFTDKMGAGVGKAQTRRENHIWFSSRLTNGASKLSFQLKLFLHCKVQLFREQP